MKKEIIFPKGFLWGTASAGHQVEGGNEKSDWWKFESEGKVYDGTVSGKAVDYRNRYEEDHEMMAKLGYQAFRLGIEWARVEPEDGVFDMKAVRHYEKILRSLRKHNIKICLTLYHWVLPLWFAEKGGWEHPEAADRFMAFCELIIKELGEYPDLWVTLNEPNVPAAAGCLAGVFPPEKKSFASFCKVSNTLLKSHARCYRLIHDIVPKGPDGWPSKVGVANAYQHVAPFGTPGLAGAYEKALSPVLAYGSFKAWDYSVATGWIVPPFGLEHVPGLKDSYDYCGVNYYTRMSLKFDAAKTDDMLIDIHGIQPGIEMNQMGWENYPPGFFHTLKFVWNTFKKPIYITENGCADPQRDDIDRRRYLLEHMAQIARALDAGIDVRGYFQWSFTDNFEWREGFIKKLGLIECDYADPELKRIPRVSAAMYADIVKKNGITTKLLEKYAPDCADGVFGDKWMDQ